jgi:hypothetical protein
MKTATGLVIVAAIALLSILLLGRPKMWAATIASDPREARAAEGALEQQIVAKEREGLDALKAGDVERFGRLTAEDAILVDTHGPASKAQVVKNVVGFRLSDYTMGEVRFLPLSTNSGLISYKIHEMGNSHGKEFAAEVYVSSIWAQRGSEWVCLFSQETGAR